MAPALHLTDSEGTDTEKRNRKRGGGTTGNSFGVGRMLFFFLQKNGKCIWENVYGLLVGPLRTSEASISYRLRVLPRPPSSTQARTAVAAAAAAVVAAAAVASTHALVPRWLQGDPQ